MAWLQGYGWLSPTVGALEFMQCLTQALTTSARKSLVQSAKVGPSCSCSSPCILLQALHADLLRCS